jgi:hypothetical protein
MADNSSTDEPSTEDIPVGEEQASVEEETSVPSTDGIIADASLEDDDEQDLVLENTDDLSEDQSATVSEYTLPLLPNDPQYDVNGDSFDESALNELLSMKTPPKETHKVAAEEEYVSFGNQGVEMSNEFLQDENIETAEVDDDEEGDDDEDMALMDPDNV